jgi:hypothetical protein
MSTELPILIRQLDSPDPLLQAAKQRLRDLAHLLQPWRTLARPELASHHLYGYVDQARRLTLDG